LGENIERVKKNKEILLPVTEDTAMHGL